MGDFNYRNIDWKTFSTSSSSASNEAKLIESVRDGYFFQHVLEPTRCRIGQKPSSIDLIFTNEEKMVTGLEYLSPLGKSDHCVLKFDFSCYSNPTSTFKPRYIYDKSDYPSIKDYMNRDWNLEFSNTHDNVDEQWKILLKHINIARTKWVPMRTGPPKWRDKGNTPLDNKCVKQIRRKRRCWQRYIETRDEQKWREYCKARNQVKKLTRQARKNIEKDIALKAKKSETILEVC